MPTVSIGNWSFTVGKMIYEDSGAILSLVRSFAAIVYYIQMRWNR